MSNFDKFMEPRLKKLVDLADKINEYFPKDENGRPIITKEMIEETKKYDFTAVVTPIMFKKDQSN